MTSFPFFPFLLLFAAVPHTISALTNVTISNNSSTITYVPNYAWYSSNSSLDYSQSHRFTNAEGASATFSFTGIAIYYLAASWPYDVGSNISLDGDAGTYVDLRDWRSTPTNGGSASANATLHWYRTGLENTSHIVVISLPTNDSDANDSDTYAVVDSLIYTIDDDNDNEDEETFSMSKVPVIVGAVLGGLALLGAIAGLFLFYHRRRKQKQGPMLWDEPILGGLVTPFNSPPSATEAQSPQMTSGPHNNTHSGRFTDMSHQPALSHSLPSPTLQFAEGSTGSSSGGGPRTSAMIAYGNETKSVVVLSPETEEPAPPAYAEFHES